MHRIPNLASWLLICLSFSALANDPPVRPWGELIEQAKRDPALETERTSFVEEASKAAALPIIRRARSLDEVGQNRTWLDGRSRALEDEIRETFALAMSDFGACNRLSKELPLLAAAYRLTDNDEYLDRVVEQLEEMAGWSPLQRPGYTLYAPGNRLPPGGDGNWLATGCGVRAIGDALDILPPGSIEEPLLERIRTLLEAEIASVVDDWETKRSWFIRTDNPITNQWVLPTEGLVRACLILGKEDHAQAYELGVKNLLKALDAHGERGEFEEGFGYASFTVTSLLHAAHAMAVAGDDRALNRPFLKHFPRWLVHHFQPGNYVINCFDAGGSYGKADVTRPLLSLLAVCTGSPVAGWALEEQVEGPSTDLAGLAAAGIVADTVPEVPPLFASYERATRVNWRSSWAPDADGVWVRGGHPLDQHDHQDRGHVNYISKGRPILIEAGTPSYDHELMPTHYSSGVGHNVLQLGEYFPEEIINTGRAAAFPGWQRAKGVAPLAVARLDKEGGEVALDGASCYEGIARWERTVEWDREGLTVKDDVSLAEDRDKEIVLFRWHLGTESEVEIETDGNHTKAVWQDAEMVFESSEPIGLSQTKLPDHTLEGHNGSEDPKNGHTCLVLRTLEPFGSVVITSRVTPKD